jgi:hypothetical protein
MGHQSGEPVEYLEGGRSPHVTRFGDTIRRPAGPWTPYVHNLLHHLRTQGFSRAPEPVGLDDGGYEVVSYLDGDVYNYPLPEAATSISALISSADLLRAYHDATVSFVPRLKGDEAWMLPARQPEEVICHGDYAPYNVVLAGDRAVGIIDFDAAHPGPRVWDLAYAVYRWSPLTRPDSADGFGSEREKAARCRLFCDTYGLPRAERGGLMSMVVERLCVLVEFMQSEAKEGNRAFQANLADGHHLAYLADIEYLETDGERFLQAPLADLSTERGKESA